MRVLVTGANGHIGSHVVRAAGEAKMTPVGFVREDADPRSLSGLDIELRKGDLLDLKSLERACEGIDILFHVAAVHRNFAVDPNVIIKPAVEGTKNALTAARSAKVKRVVYTSTAATMGFTKDPKHALTEDDFLETATSPYTVGKIEAERYVREQAKQGGMEIVIVNPSGVFGPRDYRLTPATRAVQGLLQGDPAFLHLCVTDVRDVGRTHILAAEKGKPGHRYLATGDVMSPLAIRDAVFRLSGIRPSLSTPPRFIANFLAGRMEKRAKMMDGDANLTRAIVHDNLGKHLVYDSTRARTELGATFRPGEQVIRDTVRWLLFLNALPAKVAAKVRHAMGPAAEPDSDWQS